MPKQANPNVDWTELTKALSEPFGEHEVKYRAGAVSRDKKRAQALPYADPRVYEDRLNTLVPGAWEVEFEPWGDSRIICRLAIHGITRSSTGESGDGLDAVAGTAAEAQAFKRACAKFGLGRYLYAMEPQWVDYDADKKQLALDNAMRMRRRAPTAVDGSGRIGPQRATKLGQALAGAGVSQSRQKRYASEVVGKPVENLGDLTESEAARVWNAARRRTTRSAA